MKQEPFGRILLKNFLLALGVVLVFVFVVQQWLNLYTHHGQQVVVPDVKGLSLSEARIFFDKKELHGVVVDSAFVRQKRAGTILETVPPAGNEVKEGRTIFLTINSHAALLLTIPEVKDISQRQASAMLKSIGFERVSIKKVRGAYQNLVLGLQNAHGQTVHGGERITGDTPLFLLVSSGAD
ncbi:PASTA domain-containing protein [Candidatus Symbiothrix dinenymphae]|uniref:PASTA domain-containing protein n=1 Tax=Candidatus Symbiothrix dinenymphae TaxID=467085 RepID=UPI0006C5FCA6|nr:PASTA domain-containing protein [Candidatus Symbiothrix dinenymphae]GAP73417.1 hypothetical protein SAMD00024442_9_15 [Candidatus Symbiothrix dinenymphae]